MIIFLILCGIMSIWLLLRFLHKNDEFELIFIVHMLVDVILIVTAPIFGAILVLIMEWKHIKRWKNSGKIKDFVYNR